MPDNGNSLDSCAGLEDVSYFEEWTDFDKRFKNKYGRGFPKEISLTLESFTFYSRTRGFSRRVCKILTVHIFEAFCM